MEHARRHGAEVIEGYPVESDTAGKVDVISGYVGTVKLFERAGFVRAALDDGALRWPVTGDHAQGAPHLITE